MGAAGALQAGGTALQISGQLAEGEAAKASADFNALQFEQEARLIEKKTYQDVRRFRIARRKDQASNRVAVAASGIRMQGSALEVIQENARNAAADEIEMKMSGRRQADQSRANARASRMRGKAAKRASRFGAAASALQGAGQAYTNYGGGS